MPDAVPTHTGQFFHVSLEQAQLKVGISTPILESSYDDYGCLLTFCWIKVLWECLWIYKVTLHNPDQILPKLQWEGNFFLMEHLVELQVFTDEDLLHFNHCCLVYKAMTAANILTGDGITVMKDALALHRLSHLSSPWEWPNKHPCKMDIAHWKEGLKWITSTNLTIPFDLRLGQWTQPSHLKWQWFYWHWQ